MFKQLVRSARRMTPIAIISVGSVATTTTLHAAVVPFPVSGGGTGNGYELILDSASDQSAASAAASSSGGHLVTITSSSEQSFIESLLSGASAPTGSYWMGLTRVGTSDTFAWDTGEPFAFTHFADGEPNNYPAGANAGTSGAIYWSQNPTDGNFTRRGTWNDAPLAGYPAGSLPGDLSRQGFIIEVEGAGSGTGGGGDGGGGDGGGNGGGDGGGDGGGGGNGGGGNGGGNGGGPPAVPLPPALLAAPLGMLVAGWAARRRKL
jgi:hypothetical protein